MTHVPFPHGPSNIHLRNSFFPDCRHEKIPTIVCREKLLKLRIQPPPEPLVLIYSRIVRLVIQASAEGTPGNANSR